VSVDERETGILDPPLARRPLSYVEKCNYVLARRDATKNVPNRSDDPLIQAFACYCNSDDHCRMICRGENGKRYSQRSGRSKKAATGMADFEGGFDPPTRGFSIRVQLW
jgi:hypothetical protein